MWKEQQNQPVHGPFPQALHSGGSCSNGAQTRLTKSAPCSPLKPLLAKRSTPPARSDSFHVIHKVPVGDTPYVKAKHVQLVDKDPNRAIALFWAAINAGDRVDSALKDMAIVMKQQNRPEEAIEAIKSLRFRCSDHAQESLDNVLLDLYKRCGRLDDQIALLKHKLHLIHQGLAFNGRRTKTARSQGKKFQVSIEQEATRLLGNLGWAYMQQSNFVAAEAVYRKALSIEPDNNKVCNLGICLMKQGRLQEAKAMLKSVKPACGDSPWGSDSHLKSFDRAQQMLQEMEASGGGAASELQGVAMASSAEEEAPSFPAFPSSSSSSSSSSSAAAAAAASAMAWRWSCSAQNDSASSDLSGALFATSGFGPSSSSSSSTSGGGAGAMVSSSSGSAPRPPLPPSLPPQGEAMAIAQKQSNHGLVPPLQKKAPQALQDEALVAMAFLQQNQNQNQNRNRNQNQNQGLALASVRRTNGSSSTWEEEDAEQGFGDENTDHHRHRLLLNPNPNPNPNPSQPLHLQPHQSMHWHAEALRAKLEKVAIAKNTADLSRKLGPSGYGILQQQQQQQQQRSSSAMASSANSAVNWGTTQQTLLGESNGSSLNSAALPFVVVSSAAPSSSSSSSSSSSASLSCPNTACRFSATENHHDFRIKNRAPASSSSPSSSSSSSSSSSAPHLRSPSLLSNLVLPERGVTPEQGKKSCCKSLSFFSMDKPQQQQQESHGYGGDDAWSSLGFIQADSSSPLCTIATVLRKRSSAAMSGVSPLQASSAGADEEQQRSSYGDDDAEEAEDEEEEGEDEEKAEAEEDDDDFQRRLQVFVEMTLPV